MHKWQAGKHPAESFKTAKRSNSSGKLRGGRKPSRGGNRV